MIAEAEQRIDAMARNLKYMPIATVGVDFRGVSDHCTANS